MSPHEVLALGVSAVVAAILYRMFVHAGTRAQGTRSRAISCSFCGKDQDQVRKIIAGPKVYICDECVDLCNDIIAEECDQEATQGESGTPAGDRTPSPIPARVWLVSGMFLVLLATLYLTLSLYWLP